MITDDETLAQWRKEFEIARTEDHPQPCLDRDDTGNYLAIHTWVAWRYWVKSREGYIGGVK